jgi:hypothetical protein
LENPPTKHYEKIRGEGGVCSDMSQVYNNFCVINDLKVKRVGLKIVSKTERFAGAIHLMRYTLEFKKWVLIDVSKSIFFTTLTLKYPYLFFELIN